MVGMVEYRGADSLCDHCEHQVYEESVPALWCELEGPCIMVEESDD